jgi:hypothetical protein
LRTAIAIIFKFIATYVAAWIAFIYIDGNPLMWTIIVSIAATIGNWFVGDLRVLPAYGNIIAAIGDGVLGALFAFIIATFTSNFQVSLVSLPTFALIIFAVELFFHMYILRDDRVGPRMKE